MTGDDSRNEDDECGAVGGGDPITFSLEDIQDIQMDDEDDDDDVFMDMSIPEFLGPDRPMEDSLDTGTNCSQSHYYQSTFDYTGPYCRQLEIYYLHF